MLGPLHHEDLVVASLGSGSKGNATYIGTSERGVLIDCGISTRQILARMDAVGLGDATLDAVLLTHEHTDHVGACAVLERALFKRQGDAVPFYATAGTAEGMRASLRPQGLDIARAGMPVQIGSLRAEPHRVPHDTLEPVAWVVQHGNTRAGVITDLGHLTRGTARMMGSLDVAVLEFNHDTERLMDGPYPWHLKQRIRGRHGHLSNDEGARLLREAASERLRHVLLAHLSEENNSPQLAFEAAEQGLKASAAMHAVLHVAQQGVPTSVRVSARAHAVTPPTHVTTAQQQRLFR